ncbi:DUF7507 domain-containing protein [Dongia sedimenti]|uniref:DUF7507 domain-containing protein n=1 Tax=Dongia sedimenti TaxID=3064282 RepID=A0ABU0YRR5_9PROT|nr:hypothetical protein [Rhodospirillaceae bacterium R-7]
MREADPIDRSWPNSSPRPRRKGRILRLAGSVLAISILLAGYFAVHDDPHIGVPALSVTLVGTFDDKNLNGHADVGEPIAYVMKVKNTGDLHLRRVTPKTERPRFNGRAAEGTPSAFLPASLDLAPAAEKSFTFAYTLVQADIDNGGPIYNSASASGADPQGTTVQSDPADFTIELIQSSKLYVVKDGVLNDANRNGYADTGETITYTITVKNTGNTTLHQITPQDSGPRFSGHPATGSLSAFSPASSDLAPAEERIFQATYPLAQADIDLGDTISNSATASGVDPRGSPVKASPARVTFSVDRAPQPKSSAGSNEKKTSSATARSGKVTDAKPEAQKDTSSTGMGAIGPAVTLDGSAGSEPSSAASPTPAVSTAEGRPPSAQNGSIDGDPGAIPKSEPSLETGNGLPRADDGETAFVISVDGETLDKSGARRSLAIPENGAGSGDAAMDIQIKFDGLDTKTQLNVLAIPSKSNFQAGDTVSFRTAANYPDFIDRAEIRISEVGEDGPSEPVAIVPVPVNGEAQWVVPADKMPGKRRKLTYLLRVYDKQGRYDETEALLISEARHSPVDPSDEAAVPRLGEDRTARKGISVWGGAVTVYGRNVPAGGTVEAFGAATPIDRNGSFAVQRILPPGQHRIEVAVVGPKGSLRFSRDIEIPENDWFFVALADLTVGKQIGDKGIEDVRDGEYDAVYNKGRLAFYLKGKIQGKYLVTAAADTNEEELRDLFQNLDQKDARQVLKNLDPDDFYPVYGDDSTMAEDAPTDGRLYVRLERDASHIMWGNYKTRISGTEFLKSERKLYGADAVYKSDEVTAFGERSTEVTAYGAQPDTLPQREEFLATGGSAYFMKKHDIVAGSETVTVETRDPTTGAVIGSTALIYGEDYDFNYVQGVLELAEPLSSSSGTGAAVREGALGGGKIYLVVQYEYTPSIDDLDGYSYGARVQQWIGDNLRIGITAQKEGSGDADQKAYGLDVRLRASEKTFLDMEIAHSEGPGFGADASDNGGLSWDEEQESDAGSATAWRLRGQADLAELTSDAVKGSADGYYQQKDAGFSTLNEDTSVEQTLKGAHSTLQLTEQVVADIGYDSYWDGYGRSKHSGTANLAWQIDRHWKVSLGSNYTDLENPLSSNSGWNGARLDGGLRLDHRWDEDHLAYAFNQATVFRSDDIRRNDRFGLGAELKLTDTVGIKGEASYGTLGLGGLFAFTYDPSPDDHSYLGYRLDPDRAYDPSSSDELTGADAGTIVAGKKRRVGDFASFYLEDSYDMFGERRSLIETYGLEYTPNEAWSFNASLEAGNVDDDTIDASTGLERSDYDRIGPGFGLRYKDEVAGIEAKLRGEFRIEDSEDGTRDQNTYYLTGGLSWKTSDDWRFLSHASTVISRGTSSSSALDDTNYIETSLGFAYRPIDNDRFNALFKYTNLYDVTDSAGSNGSSVGDSTDPAQISHILSADVSYDLSSWFTIGSKYGVRIGEVRGGDTGSDEWEHSTAHLGILRGDFHVVKKWDVLIEGRVMWMPEAGTTDLGAVAGLYYHVGDNLKIGAGFNAGRFSDDLRDVTLNDRGLFFNVVGKF